MGLRNKITVVCLILFTSINAQTKEEGEDYVKIGGVVRFNCFYRSWIKAKTNPTFTLELWRLNVEARKKGIDLDFDYRFYPTFGTHFMKHGWLGFTISDNIYMKLGVSQVPFGITKWASHSWWFQAPYYAGLEDDYDMGIKFDITKIPKLDINVAYYRQSEPEGPIFGGDVTFGNSGPGRYSYDIVPQPGNSNRELNQFNLRAAYHVNDNWELGLSGQIGGIYNSVLNKSTTSSAFVAHILADFSGFNLKTEYLYYHYAAKDDVGNNLQTVTMGAFGIPYQVAGEAAMYVFGLAYNLPFKPRKFDDFQIYVDYTYTDKFNDGFTDTHHLIPGGMFSIGNFYVYIDYGMGKNQPWLSPTFGTGLGQGQTYSDDITSKYYTPDITKQGTVVKMKDLDWERRLNINIGYYF